MKKVGGGGKKKEERGKWMRRKGIWEVLGGVAQPKQLWKEGRENGKYGREGWDVGLSILSLTTRGCRAGVRGEKRDLGGGGCPSPLYAIV